MRLYIFKPSESWAYCGGARIAIAENMESAARLFIDKDLAADSIESADDVCYAMCEGAVPEKRSREGVDVWILTESFPVAEAQPRIVLDDWNYA